MGSCFGKIASNMIFFSEKFSMCLSFTALITCVIFTMIFMLAFGIGIGYNYSYVDFRTRHTYLALEGYRKVRPTSYYGTGFYKPTTLNDSEFFRVYGRTKTTTKTTTTKRRSLRGGEEEALELITKNPDAMPNESPIELIKDRRGPVIKLNPNGPPIEQLYFSTPRPTIPFYLVDMTTSPSKVTKEKADDALNATHINDWKYGSDAEPITVNVTKLTRDSAPPLIIKTMMHPNQLMNWLSRLREANKTFAVHIITN